MLARETSPDTFEIWRGGSAEPLGELAAIIDASEVERLWGEDELASHGLHRVADPGIPPGFVATGAPTIERVNGAVSFVYQLAEAPPAEPNDKPPLEPWRFWSILDIAGPGGDALRAVIGSHPDPMFRAMAKARLNNPPGGYFRRSDAMFANAELLGAMGMNAASVDALWDAGLALPDPNA